MLVNRQYRQQFSTLEQPCHWLIDSFNLMINDIWSYEFDVGSI